MNGEVTTLISLDTSTRNTGYSLYKNGTLSSYGSVSTKGNEPLDKMLGKLASLLGKHSPDIVKGTDETLPRTRKELKEWSVMKASEYSHKELASNDVSDAILIGQAYINLTTKGDTL